ncbi:hypothetical protein, partial [Burkholderia sp. MSMB1072]|uniref:hypothetical protein n=1 Tax=Burkholderia sp. MSMB1072 TaxID=1637871 RepID=UPI00211D2FC8
MLPPDPPLPPLPVPPEPVPPDPVPPVPPPPLLLVPDPPDATDEELSSPPQAVSATQVNAISTAAFIGVPFQTNWTNEAGTRASRRTH